MKKTSWATIEMMAQLIDAANSESLKVVRDRFLSEYDESKHEFINRIASWISTSQKAPEDIEEFDPAEGQRKKDLANRRVAKIRSLNQNRIVELDTVCGGYEAPLLTAMADIGECPFSSKSSEKLVPVGGAWDQRWWTSYFDSSNWRIRNDLNTSEQLQFSVFINRLRKQTLGATFGRIIYDLDMHGLGYACLKPESLTPPPEMTLEAFWDCCNSILRILGQEYRTDPHIHRPNPEDPWNNSDLTDSSTGRKKSPHPKFHSACCGEIADSQLGIATR